ncbi:MAG TPA: hypothetical protein VMH32_21705 [Burkholderiales bacterium]|nr:hypothetical protein [Burkholderiales bacterium]
MARRGDIYGHINGESDMRRVFKDIRQDVAEADSRPMLTELYRRAGYLITLTYAPSWEEKFGREALELRKVAENEFRVTAQLINRRAEQIGSAADYRDTWGRGAPTGRARSGRRSRGSATNSEVDL